MPRNRSWPASRSLGDEALLASVDCARVLYVDHVVGDGDRLFEAARRLGVEGIVSKKLGSRYRGGPSRDWVKTKVSQTGTFVVIGFKETAAGKLEAIIVAGARGPARVGRRGAVRDRAWAMDGTRRAARWPSR